MTRRWASALPPAIRESQSESSSQRTRSSAAQTLPRVTRSGRTSVRVHARNADLNRPFHLRTISSRVTSSSASFAATYKFSSFATFMSSAFARSFGVGFSLQSPPLQCLYRSLCISEVLLGWFPSPFHLPNMSRLSVTANHARRSCEKTRGLGWTRVGRIRVGKGYPRMSSTVSVKSGNASGASRWPWPSVRTS